MTKQEIIDIIDNWRNDIPYEYFYIGITDNINERLFGYHKPDAGCDFYQADSETIARDVEKYFLNKNMKGGTGGGKKPTFVYVYQITENTVE
ncbi:hypothetical protein SDC9_104364 [bioreactor metagenome]|uniref:Uncharacterized protein n=1 Tax=bioreactor metagenome TaxID=1076179 RepID=A0A645AWB8_9ZZZZ|nr:hypothetical protein [Cloacibacillus evryensis]MEA5034222.1 hypothetical protein [Cloacibacillus evryensis]